ncbi:MAG: rhodanese-like domain-containing protein [Steroidobacteraceae bacterium]
MDRLIEFIHHHPLLAAAAVVTATLVVGYESRLRAHGASAISPQELIRLMNQGALVLDIRPTEQYAAGHIGGARQMPTDQLSKAGDTLKKHKGKPVIVYCDSGSLASAAVRQLTAQGFSKAFSLRGGVTAWRAENLPLAKT